MNQNNPQLIKASVVTVIIAGILGVLTILAGDIGATSGKVFILSFALILFGILGTICMVVTRKPEYKTLGLAGMFIAGLGFLLTFIIVLTDLGDEGISKFALVCLILSIAMAHICLLHHFNLQNKYAVYARITATTAIAIFSFCLILRVFQPIQGLYSLAYDQSTLKLLASAFVVDLAATLLVPLCNRLQVAAPSIELDLGKETPAPVEPESKEEAD